MDQEALSPPILLAAFLVLTHSSGLVLGSLSAAMVTALLSLSAAGVVLWIRGTSIPLLPRIPREAGLVSIVVGLIVLPLALWWNFHDEILWLGHLSIVSSLQNDHYPPRHLSFPQFELRYHYAFDLLAAALSGLFRLSTERAIDALSVVSALISGTLLWRVGNQLSGRVGGLLAPFLLFLGGGFTLLCTHQAIPGWISFAQGHCSVADSVLNPPFISNFFQHPWAIGTPLALAILVLLLSPRPSGSKLFYREAVLALLFIALSFSQFVLFLCLIASRAGAELLSSRKNLRQSLVPFAFSVLSVLIASRLHGFFLPGPNTSEPSVYFDWSGHVSGSWLLSLRWFLATFGFILPLGAYGLWRIRKLAPFLGLLAGGSLLVLMFFKYRYSWDIVKFGTVALIALALGAVVPLSEWIRRPDRKALGFVFFALCIVEGITYSTPFILRSKEVPYPRSPLRYATDLSIDDARAISWLRKNVAPTEVIYRKASVAPYYASLGGLAQTWVDAGTEGFGFPQSLMRPRREFEKSFPASPRAFTEQQIHWIILDESEGGALEAVRSWERNKQSVLAWKSGGVHVYRLP